MNASVRAKRAAPVPPDMHVKPIPAGRSGSINSDTVADQAVHDAASIKSSRKSSHQDDTITLHVIVPNGQTYPFQVNRRMPLMDLLVHAASMYHFNPSEYAVYNPQARFQSSFTPNTPVGELNTEFVQIVSKNSPELNTFSKPSKIGKTVSLQSGQSEPFEKTFRLEVNLPHKQKTFLRVKPGMTLRDVLNEICREKILDARLYTLRNPKNPDQQLDMYRQIGDERTSVIDLVPAVQDMADGDNRKFGTLSEINMEPPGSPIYEKKGFGNIFRLCRKKRSHTSKNFTAVAMTKEFPLNGSRNFSRSMASLSTDYNSTRDFQSNSTNKRAAPRPPSVQPTTNSATTQLQNGSENYTSSVVEQRERVRHNSESSGFDESVVLSNSPERDGCLADDQQSPSPVNDVTESAKWRMADKPVPAPRSTSSTPDSGLKSTSEVMAKTAAGGSKKKAPAPPPPGSVKEIPNLSQTSSIVPQQGKPQNGPTSESGSIISQQISTASVSSRETTGSSKTNQGLPQNASSNTLRAATLPENPKPERELSDDIGSFSFEDSIPGSVIGENFDAGSSNGSITGQNTIQSDVDVHSQPPSIHDDRNLDWDSNFKAPEDESTRISLDDSWSNLKKIKIEPIKVTDRSKSASVSLSDVQMQLSSEVPLEPPPEFASDQKQIKGVSFTKFANEFISTEPEKVTPSPVLHSEKVTRPPSPKAALPKTSPELKLVIPSVAQQVPSQPSPSPSTTSTATSMSSLREPPPLPDSTPPVISSVLTKFSQVPRSPAHISISSFSDQPNRYKDITSRPNSFPTEQNSKTVSREELLKEMKLVQDTIASMHEQLQNIHQKSTITNKDLSVIEENNRVLKEHYQRQMALTEQLLEKTDEEKSTPVPPPSAWERLGLIRSESGREQQKMVENNFTILRKNFAAVPAAAKKVPVVTKRNSVILEQNSVIPQRNGSGSGDTKEDIKFQTRPKAVHKNSWIAEASKRFDFTDQPSTATLPPTPAFSTSVAPEAPSTSKMKIVDQDFSSDYNNTFSFAVDRVSKQTQAVSAFRQASMSSPITSKPLLGQVSVKNVPTRTSTVIEQSDPLLSPQPFHKFSTKDPSRTQEMREKSEPILKENSISTGDPVESVVRSWKNGTPTPYHHVKVNQIGQAPAVPVAVIGVNGKAKENVVDTLPPPPPKLSEKMRSISVPLKPVNGKQPVHSRSKSGEPTSGDTKNVLMSEIRNFPFNTLRKVPVSAQKTWVPKVR